MVIADGMHTVMTLLLIRFGFIAAADVVVAIVLFTIALFLKRKGKLESVVSKAAPVTRAYLDRPARRGRGNIKRTLGNSALDYVEKRSKS